MAVYVNTEVSSWSDKSYLHNVQNSLNVTYHRLYTGLRLSAAKGEDQSEHIFDHPSSDAPRHQDR